MNQTPEPVGDSEPFDFDFFLADPQQRAAAEEAEERAAFGERIRRLRVEQGITQEELAETTGVAVASITEIERGLRSMVTEDIVRRVLAGLGVPRRNSSWHTR